jgi:DNA topoisomerase-1
VAALSPPSWNAFFTKYVQYDFTANLEDQLDEISGARIAWKKVLKDFWTDFTTAVAEPKTSPSRR